ncbi:MAG TPA: interleukin-like EMT inducer domain-containing protein, partial [Ardenticatenaceae bacterium]|nr:interleukin-like EMT inducer domain-containing protein [Ardenticatenaceae bacterium]
MRRLPARAHLAVALFYFVGGALLWWPLPLHLTTHVPGSATWAFDEYTFIWNLWWFKAALLRFGTNPLHSDFIFHPLGIDLVLYTYNLFNALVAFPILDLLGLILTSNLLLLGMTALSGWGTFLLVRWLLSYEMSGVGYQVSSSESGSNPHSPVSFLAPLAAGALYAFGAYRSIYAALGHYDMVSTGFIPLVALFFLKSMRTRSRQAPVLGGIFLAGALLNEMIFGVFLGMLALALLAFNVRSAARGWPARLVILGGLAAVLWAPVGLPVVRTFLNSDFALEGWGDALKLSADLWSFTTPVALHPVFGGDWVRELRAVQEGTARFADVNTVFVGVGALLAAAVGAWRFRAQLRAWTLAGLAMADFSLGPLLQINGRWRFDFDGIESGVPLPFIVLHYLPIVKGNRAPNRFSVVLMLCAAVLVGYSLWWLGQVVRDRRSLSIPGRYQGATGGLVIGALVGILLFEQLALPLPLTDARVPEVYWRLAAEPGDFAVLSLPAGWRSSFGVAGSEDTRTQYYQSVHAKRLPSGNISRAPAFKFSYFERLPVFRTLINVERDVNYRPTEEEVAADRAQADAVARLLDLRYVVVNPPVPGRPPYSDTYTATLDYAQRMWELEPVIEGESALFRIRRSPQPAELEIDFGDPSSVMYRGEGWDRDEPDVGGASAAWAVGQAALVLLPLDRVPPSASLRLRIAPFDEPGAGPQTLELWANGEPVGSSVMLATGWNEHSFTVPGDLLREGTNRLTLRFGRATRPRDVIPQSRVVGTTGVVLDAVVAVTSDGGSGGQEIGYISVDGEDASENRRGVNVTVLEAGSGAVVAVRGFDTAANPYETDRLVEFLASVPDGRVVVVAFQGNAVAHLTPRAREALLDLGAANVPESSNASFALIGVKGAAPGTA